MVLDVRQMRYFAAIAERRSFSAAARALGIAQPSLSQQVKNLEERLGVQLLVRSPRGVTPTEAGAILLGHARKVIDAVETADAEVRLAGTEPSGRVSFGFPSSASMVLAVPLVETIRLDYPLIKFRAVDAMSGFIKGWLEDRSIDLGILYDVRDLRNMESRCLLTEDMALYSAPDNWPLESPPATPTPLAALAGLDLVLPSRNHGPRVLIDRVCAASGNVLNVVVEMDSLTQIKSLVARGSAHTILAPAAVYDLESKGELVSAPIVDPVIRRSVYLVRNPQKRLTRATHEVEALTRRVAAELVERNIWKGRLVDG